MGNTAAEYTQGLGIDEPLAVLRLGATSFYEADGLGSITSLSDSSGAITATYTYDSFGKLTASIGNPTNPFRYTGREFDSETGLYYYRARYYDPGVGRFLSEDPIDFDGGVNFYRYVENNPVRWIDQSGLDVTITVYKGMPGNPFGHVGIGVTGFATVGFDDLRDDYNRAAAEGQTVPGAVNPINDANRAVLDRVTIATTPDQDKRILEYIQDRTKNPVNYNLLNRNCALFAADALAAAGINVKRTKYPRALLRELHRIEHLLPPEIERQMMISLGQGIFIPRLIPFE